VCIKGTHAIAKTIQTFNQHGASDADRENLIRWGKILPGKGACAFLDGAAALGRSLVAHFPDEVAAGVLREKTREEHA
jgi:NADH:ubiquinone oxidoreductase subunit F (NADH-binding)